MNNDRTENDMLGELRLPADALYGIHTLRAARNFDLSGRRVHPELIRAYGSVKLACLTAIHALTPWEDAIWTALQNACSELSTGDLDEWIITDALQGGAGTSLNMNVNEVIANRALVLTGNPPGRYEVISPLEDVNRHQSTNDTYPTALKTAAIRMIRTLAEELTALQEAFQKKEHELADIVKVGRTEMQDAVLTTLGREMSAYGESLSRDRWRVFKCEERLRVINLGGTAIGTGLGAPRQYIFTVTDHLRSITGIGFSRAENLVDATQNADLFAEVSGILKTVAVNIMKISNDLRFLSCGPEAGIGELRLPPQQAGSSIMPAKINPVIPEAAVQCALKVMANDQAVTAACASGHLELNPFLPLVAESLLENLTLLTKAAAMLRERCVDGITADPQACHRQVRGSTAILTALSGELGYKKAAAIAAAASTAGMSIPNYLAGQGIMTEEQINDHISPERVMRLGDI